LHTLNQPNLSPNDRFRKKIKIFSKPKRTPTPQPKQGESQGKGNRQTKKECQARNLPDTLFFRASTFPEAQVTILTPKTNEGFLELLPKTSNVR